MLQEMIITGFYIVYFEIIYLLFTKKWDIDYCKNWLRITILKPHPPPPPTFPSPEK